MAGNYPDVPAPRMAIDRDGTILVNVDIAASTATQIAGSNIATMNNESSNTYRFSGNNFSYTYGLTLIFPQLRTLTGILVQSSESIPTLQWSPDTTNGLDGVWNTTTPPATTGYNKENMRNNIVSLALSGVKAIRLYKSETAFGNANVCDIYCWHLYGNIESGQSPDRLRMWHPTLDEPLDDNTSADGAFLDFGDVARSTSQDRAFRIKNNSATMTANSISVSIDVPTDTAPTVASQHTLSDGGAFASSINIGNLAPGATSSVITIRRITLSNAGLSLWTGRVIADPGSWT